MKNLYTLARVTSRSNRSVAAAKECSALLLQQSHERRSEAKLVELATIPTSHKSCTGSETNGNDGPSDHL